MNNGTRTGNSLKNMAFGLGSQLISMIVGFCTRWMFLAMLGKEYLGVAGLFTNILSLLSLANLGFGTAIVYSLYKPLAQNDTETVKAYMDLYRKVYRIVGVAVLVLGLALLPCLPWFIKDEVTIPENLNIIYVLFLLQSSASYFFSYKQTLLAADQKNSVISSQHSIWMIIRNIAELIILYFTHAYIPVLIIIVICQIGENAWIAHVCNRHYPFLKEKTIRARITDGQKQELKKNVGALFLYRVSGTVISSTDNIVISTFIGLASVGVYGNYVYIVDVVRTFLGYIFNSLTASVGNYNATETAESNLKLFNLLFFASFWFYGLCSVCLLVLLNPFIRLWIGESYILPDLTVLLVVLNFYTAGVQYAATTYREVTGLFAVGKYRPLIAAALNLVVSVALAVPLGIAGVLIGTVASRFAVYFWYDPYIIFRKIFNKPLYTYFLRYFVYFLTTSASCVMCILVRDNLPGQGGALSFVISALVCALLPNVLFLLLFGRTEEFSKIKSYARVFVSKLKMCKSK